MLKYIFKYFSQTAFDFNKYFIEIKFAAHAQKTPSSSGNTDFQ